MTYQILQQPAEGLPNLIRGQLVDEFDALFRIPWTHHQYIIDKVKGDPHKALFFVKKSLQNQWGRAMLLNFLSTDIYERQHEELNNFQTTRFDFPDAGQVTGYVNMVNDLLNTPIEQPAIGLLICKEKNTILARYALQGLTTPIGIADYQVTTQELPEELQGYLPTYQELEHVLTQNAPQLPEEDDQDKDDD